MPDSVVIESVARARDFVRARATGLPGEHTFCPGGQVSLYASCYAALALHTLGGLASLTPGERMAWCDYLNEWQDPGTGMYEGPELAPDEFARPDLDPTYVRLHLAAHVLPALGLLGGHPAHPLRFARPFADPDRLRLWLQARDWRRAWLEGNNLLFVGQFLLHLRDHEAEPRAEGALDLYFDWLDGQQDPSTGLWGTNGYCDGYEALYGAYHQLLVYHCCHRPVRHTERIIDTVLTLQHRDGSFSRLPGGGACEDVDAVDVLVNLVKRTGYRLDDVCRALELAVPHLLRQQAPDGGFVFRWGRSYMQSGLLRTFAPVGTADLFSTWFRLHTLALISQVIEVPELEGAAWGFNPTCSMGWHDLGSGGSVSAHWHSVAAIREPASGSREEARRPLETRRGSHTAESESLARQGSAPGVSPSDLGRRLLGRFVRALPPDRALRVLVGLDALLGRLDREDGQDTLAFTTRSYLDRLGRERAYELAGGLEVQFWWALAYRCLVRHLSPGERVVHLGCGSGSLSFSMASQAGVVVTASDADPVQVGAARVRYHHPRLSFAPATALPLPDIPPDVVVLTDLEDGRAAWHRWSVCWLHWAEVPVLAQLTAAPPSWRHAARALKVSQAQALGLVPSGWSVLSVDQEGGSAFARLRPPPGKAVSAYD
jgi:hypothetical protein